MTTKNEKSLSNLVAELESEVKQLRERLEMGPNGAVFARIATLESQLATAQTHIEKLADAGLEGISHVGAANYAEREREAKQWVDKAYSDAIRALAPK